MDEIIPGFWSNFWAGLVSGVAILLFGQLLLPLQRWAAERLRRTKPFSIGGIWVGLCALPSYGGEPAIEIYRISVRGENVKLMFFNYRRKGPAEKHYGAGVYRGKRLAAYYYTAEVVTYEVGVLLLTLEENMLAGAYMQHDERAAEILVVSKDPSSEGERFSLARARLDLAAQLRLLLGWPPYRSYGGAEALHQSLHNKDEIDPR